MRRVLPLLLLVCVPAAARASWAYVSVAQLVRESDLVVVGTLRDVRGWTADGEDYGEGRIDVREVIRGEAAPGDSLLLKWSNASANICPRVEHKDDAGTEGIWLLTRDGDAVAADYPGRFVALSRRAEVEAALPKLPAARRAEGKPRIVNPAPVRVTVEVFAEPRRGLAPLTRAGLAALDALLLFPFFLRLRSTLAGARLTGGAGAAGLEVG